MSPRINPPARRPVPVALCLIALCFAVALICAAGAHAAEYKMLLCAGNNGSNDFGRSTNSANMTIENYCGPAGDPAGGDAFLRITENKGGGPMAEGNYAFVHWDTPPWIHYRQAGGYTRQPESFNDGWRGRFWIAGGSAGDRQIFAQGAGLPNNGELWGSWPTFQPHLWHQGGYLDATRFAFEMRCVRPAGCETSGFNATDLNTINFVLSDEFPSQVLLTSTGDPFMDGGWVKGTHWVAWTWTERGSGLRYERIYIDSAQVHAVEQGCNLGWSPASGEFARAFQPCPTYENFTRGHPVDTWNFHDGAHWLVACTQDYAQAQGFAGTGGQTCDGRVIRTDNTAPGAPTNLTVTSANPNRYLDRFGAQFGLPANNGSPITKVHYEVINAAGEAVMPEKVVAAVNPTTIPEIAGPARAGAYELRVRLEDEVGFVGPPATAPIPRDTIPPAAPQDLRVAGPAGRWAERLDLRWRNVVDAGSLIVAARARVLDAAGEVVIPARPVGGEGIQSIDGLQTPPRRGDYRVEVWLSDEEGNVGAPASLPLPRDTTPPAAPQVLAVTAPTTSRAAEGFDLRWRNIVDAGSPIDAAHYQVLGNDGKVIVATRTVAGENPEAVANLDAPGQGGSYQLRLWLSDAEGNVGAPVTAPLSYECMRSETAGADQLSASFEGRPEQVVGQGQGTILGGSLRGPAGAIGTAPVCVFSRVATDQGRDFLGTALTNGSGAYRFPIPAGPSREVIALHRPDQRELRASASLRVVVNPTLRARSTTVRNGDSAYFEGEIPGPHNDNVTIVLQVKSGKGWLAFRRYRTRNDGHFEMVYPFRRTTRPTSYEMRAQVREAGGYPYVEGDSDPVTIRVLSAPTKTKKPVVKGRCAKKKRAGRPGPKRCPKGTGQKAHSKAVR